MGDAGLLKTAAEVAKSLATADHNRYTAQFHQLELLSSSNFSLPCSELVVAPSLELLYERIEWIVDDDRPQIPGIRCE